MATTRAPTQTWTARQGTVYIGKSIGVSTTSTLSGTFSTSANVYDVSAAAKNITITPPETAYEKQDLLGKNTSDFQNQLLDEKPVGLASMTATLVVGEDEMIEDLVVSGTVTAPAGYTRYQVGKRSDNVVHVCVTMNTNDSANMASFALFNAKVTKHGDVRISGPDSHWEQDINVVCLAKDYYYEFKN